MNSLNSLEFNADEQWVFDLARVFNYGIKSSPRGMEIHEVLGYRSVIDMKNPIIYNRDRKLGYKFMAAEAAWILSGFDTVDTIAPYSKDIVNYSDDGEVFFGAYGPKIQDQLEYVVETLIRDPDTRQAVVNIWRENPPQSKDIPCTLSLQLLRRHNTLNCFATMRSSDLWLGHPYDIVNFSCFAFMVSLLIRDRTGEVLDLGVLHLTAGSKHIYERNFGSVGKIIDKFYGKKPNKIVVREPVFIQERYDDAVYFIEHLWDLANSDEGMLGINR